MAKYVSLAGLARAVARLSGDISAASRTDAELFLAAHPVGSVYETASRGNPASEYGGTWDEHAPNQYRAWCYVRRS